MSSTMYWSYNKLNCGLFVSCNNCRHIEVKPDKEPCVSCAALNRNATSVSYGLAKLSDFSDNYSPILPEYFELEKQCVLKYAEEMQAIRDDIERFKSDMQSKMRKITAEMRSDGIKDVNQFLHRQYQFGGSVHLSLIK